ncbi:TPA: dTMP kinase, partial [Campylobacter jejuni]|nr:dTMP kinase [Campylobacter jejuni]
EILTLDAKESKEKLHQQIKEFLQ